MIKDTLGAVLSLLKAYDEGKKQLFEQHVDPLMRTMTEVHADYVLAFGEVRSSLAKKEVPSSDLLDFLKTRRRQLADKRQLAQVLAEQIALGERRPVRQQAWNEVIVFCDAVVDYFDASDAVARPSWFTDFMNFMTAARSAQMEHRFFDRNVFGNDPRQDLIDHIDLILDKRLPSRLRNVQTAYASLRMALL